MEETTQMAGSKAVESPLATVLIAHEKNHAQLADVLSVLENRLAVLLHPQSDVEPGNNSASDAPVAPRSDLVHVVENSNGRLARSTNRIRVLLERLEV